MKLVEISRALLVYGPLGIVAAIGLVFGVSMFKTLSRERKERDKLLSKERAERDAERQAQHDKHKIEMRACEDRHITDAEKWMEKHHDLARELTVVVDGLKETNAELQKLLKRRRGD